MRLSAELLTVRNRLTANDVSPLERVRLAARGLEIRALLGASAQPQPEPAGATSIALTGKEFGEFPDTPEGKKELRAAAKTYLEGMRGQMVNCPVLGAKVEIRQRGIKETLAFSGNPKKLKLMHAIPQIIATATAAVREDNHKKAKKPFVEAYFFLKSTVELEGEQIALHVVIEQDDKGRLYYDLMVDPPKEKAMLDSSGVSPDNYSGLPQEQDIASVSKGSPDNYSGLLLDSSVGQLSGAVMLDDVGGLVLNLFLDGDVEGGATNEAAPGLKALATGTQVQKNGSVLVTGDPVALMAYAAANFDANKIKQADEGIVFTKAQARLAEFVPTSANTLASGAVIYEHGSMGGGASVAYQGETSGVARDLADLKGLMAREWGPEKFRAVFGEDASPEDVQAYQDNQQAISDRKAANAQAEADQAAAPELERQKAAEQAAAEAAELEQIRAKREEEARALYATTTGAGVSDNPVYQAYLDTLETLPTFEEGNAAFLGWAGIRVGEFEAKTGGRVGHSREAYLAYLREYAESHLSERARASRAAPGPSLTEKGNPLIDEAVLVDLGLIREVFGRWKYRYAVGAPELFATTKEGAIEQGSDAYAKADPSELLTKEQRFEKSNADFYADFDARYGKMSIDQVRNIMEAAKPDPVAHAAAVLREFNGGGRRTGPAVATQGAREGAELARHLERYLAEREAKEGTGTEVADQDIPKPVEGETPPSPPKPADIVEYTTKKGKVLRGIVRTDMTLEQAKAIDPYTWKMNGGYFIREKHLGEETSHIQAAPAPVVMTAEQQAEAVATAQRQAEERAKQALATQVEKLRQVANKAIDNADSSLNSDRKTNTSKRAREAGYAIEKASTDKAAAQTLNRLADSIEAGAGGMLAKLSSRAQLDELQRIMRRAMSDADSKLGGMEQSTRRGRPFEDNDLKFVTYPRPESWSNRYTNAAKTLATKSAKGNSRLIAALAKLGTGRERFVLDDAAIALTRKGYAELKKVKEGWDLVDPMEAIGRADRLARMGITDHVTLTAAIQELIPHLVEKAQEDPVKKAERAIIGQKVGIDFFPTPAHVAQRMARMARIREGMRVLEPSAGNGNLADAAKAEGGLVDVIEISSQLRDILTAKGYTVVDNDFEGFTPDKPYDAILMNPPFSQRRDAAHIMRAFGMLASGGTLVAIAGEGVFIGSDQKAVAFREWLDTHEADVEALEGGTFNDNALLAQTSANARLVMLRK